MERLTNPLLGLDQAQAILGGMFADALARRRILLWNRGLGDSLCRRPVLGCCRIALQCMGGMKGFRRPCSRNLAQPERSAVANRSLDRARLATREKVRIVPGPVRIIHQSLAEWHGGCPPPRLVAKRRAVIGWRRGGKFRINSYSETFRLNRTTANNFNQTIYGPPSSTGR